MIQIDDKLLSDDVIEKKFVCDLKKCKGECCVAGDSGAPLKYLETQLLDELFPFFKEYMRPEGIKAVEQNGAYYEDEEGEFVTQLIDNKECAYVVFDKDKIAWCAIEKAFNDGKIDFRKPSSCFLYPIRIKHFSELTAVNYDEWDICKNALKLGKKTGTEVYKFLKIPLSEEFGDEWYEKLCYYAQNEHKK